MTHTEGNLVAHWAGLNNPYKSWRLLVILNFINGMFQR